VELKRFLDRQDMKKAASAFPLPSPPWNFLTTTFHNEYIFSKSFIEFKDRLRLEMGD
jgi:hypothetical protein